MCASPVRKLRDEGGATPRYYPVSEYFKPMERRSASLNVRITKSIEDGLADLVRLWTHLEEFSTPPPRDGDKKKKVEPVAVTVSDVVNRLLEVGLVGAFAEYGGRPQTEEQWKELLREARRRLASQK